MEGYLDGGWWRPCRVRGDRVAAPEQIGQPFNLRQQFLAENGVWLAYKDSGPVRRELAAPVVPEVAGSLDCVEVLEVVPTLAWSGAWDRW